MALLDSMHQAVDLLADMPGLKQYRRKRYDEHFAANRQSNLFRGVFDTFEGARDDAPGSRPLGYDNEASAGLYLNRTQRVFPADYPVMYWLRELLNEGRTTIVDLGGHIGVTYYAYRQHMRYPDALRWTVYDVPAVVVEGRRIATTQDPERQLAFSDEFDVADGADVLMALGSLQYLPVTLAEMIADLPRRPRHLLLNLTPLHPKLSYFTLQSIGTAFCPYRISAEKELLQSLEKLGYTLADRWMNPEKGCTIPFHPGHSLEGYHGFFFRLSN